MAYPTFASGDVLTASDMNAVGLWLVKTQTVGTSVSTVTVSGAFSSTYDNYRISIANISGSTGSDIELKLGSQTNGTYGSYYYDLYSGATTGTYRSTNLAVARICGIANGAQMAVTFDIQNPYLATHTIMSGTWSGNGYAGWFGYNQASNTQFTAFTISVAAGAMTGGTIRVYGYRN